MPQRRQQIIQAGAILLRAFIDIFRVHYRSFFGTEQFGGNIELGFVLFAIVVGKSEKKPMTATDIASRAVMSEYSRTARTLSARHSRGHACCLASPRKICQRQSACISMI